MVDQNECLYRIVDANLNRLREALRVVEEYVRFLTAHEELTAQLKRMRHSLRELESRVGRERLLASRDTLTDPLASATRPEELDRESVDDVMSANCKRAQEAARVLEEYLKATRLADLSAPAKMLRFNLYAFEKRLMEYLRDGQGEEN